QIIVRGYRRAPALAERTVSSGSDHRSPSDSGGGDARSVLSEFMVKLYNKQTNEFLGRISQRQLQFLRAHLEEESPLDKDYYLTKETVDSFDREGGDEKLVTLLRAAMKPAPAIEIRWEPDKSKV